MFRRKETNDQIRKRLDKISPSTMDAQTALDELYRYFLGKGFIVIDVGSIDQANYMVVFYIERIYKGKKDKKLFKKRETERQTYERLDKVARNKKTSMDAQTALDELFYYFIGNAMFLTSNQEEINYNMVYIIESNYKGKRK